MGDIWALVKVQAVVSSSNNPFVTFIGEMNTPKFCGVFAEAVMMSDRHSMVQF